MPATDPDHHQTEFLRYVILETSGDNADVFALDACTGQLSVASDVLDHETTESYLVTIQVSDGIHPIPGTAVTTVNVTITDVNERPTFIPTSSFSIVESAPIGSIVGTVQAEFVETIGVLGLV